MQEAQGAPAGLVPWAGGFGEAVRGVRTSRSAHTHHIDFTVGSQSRQLWHFWGGPMQAKSLERLRTFAATECVAALATLLLTAFLVFSFFTWAIATSAQPFDPSTLDGTLGLATGLWRLLAIYLLPFALILGRPAFLVARPIFTSPWPSFVISVVATAAAANFAYPAVEQCDISIGARPRMMKRLTPAEAATLQPLDALPLIGDTCSVSFKFRRDGRWVELWIVQDIIHGPKIFEGPYVGL